MTAETLTPTPAPQRPTQPPAMNALTAGRLPKWSMPVFLIASFIISFVIFYIVWTMSDHEELVTVVAQTGKVTVNYNWGGFLAVGALLYVIVSWFVSFLFEGSRQALDRLMKSLVVTAFVLAIIPLASLIFTLVINGMPGILDPHFFINDASKPGQRGGLHAIIGTLLITGFTSLVSIPVGIFTAIYLVEYGKGNRLSNAINFFVDVMTGIPSIVAGLFAFALFMLITQVSGGDITSVRSGIVGGVALVVLMLPTVVRSSEEMLRLVPHELREASYALGVPKWRTIVKVVLPTALAGLVTGALLAVARVIGETAPLLVAAGVSIHLNSNLGAEVMSSLPTFVYQQWGFATEEGNQLAWGGALVLLFIVILFNLVGRTVSYFFSPKGGR